MTDYRYVLYLLVPLLVFCLGYYRGYSNEHAYCEQQWSAYQAELAKQSAEIEIMVKENELHKKDVAMAVSNEQSKSSSAILDKYLQLSNISFAVASTADRLHCAESARGQDSMPDASRPSAKSETCGEVKRDGADNKKFQRLYQRQLALARAHEECESKLDAVVKFYDEVKK